ncbi:unnamed protein product [Moneuplotes crassus]|uniref:Uncharacterized protein n=1 Tax=Euplotes crassus TaxID=5936 RepID=A0AAD1X617_EUPCR|nr:unnamed protein product [Moneuplotes crassus]
MVHLVCSIINLNISHLIDNLVVRCTSVLVRRRVCVSILDCFNLLCLLRLEILLLLHLSLNLVLNFCFFLLFF